MEHLIYFWTNYVFAEFVTNFRAIISSDIYKFSRKNPQARTQEKTGGETAPLPKKNL